MTSENTDWVVDRLTAVQGVRHVVVLTVDGMLRARSAGIGVDAAERLAARCSGLQSLARDQAGEFGDGDKAVHQLMVQHQGGLLLVRAAAAGSCLAVVTEPVINPALIGQEMQSMALKLGEQVLGTPARRLS